MSRIPTTTEATSTGGGAGQHSHQPLEPLPPERVSQHSRPAAGSRGQSESVGEIVEEETSALPRRHAAAAPSMTMTRRSSSESPRRRHSGHVHEILEDDSCCLPRNTPHYSALRTDPPAAATDVSKCKCGCGRCIIWIHDKSCWIGGILSLALSIIGFALLRYTEDFTKFYTKKKEEGRIPVSTEGGLILIAFILYLLMLLGIWILNLYSRCVKRLRHDINNSPGGQQQQQQQGSTTWWLCSSAFPWDTILHYPNLLIGSILLQFNTIMIEYYDAMYRTCNCILCMLFIYTCVQLAFDFTQPQSFYGVIVILFGALSFMLAIWSTEDFGLLDGFIGNAVMISQNYQKDTSLPLLVAFIPGVMKYLVAPSISALYRRSKEEAQRQTEHQQQQQQQV